MIAIATICISNKALEVVVWHLLTKYRGRRLIGLEAKAHI
jgi:hypothetical protein